MEYINSLNAEASLSSWVTKVASVSLTMDWLGITMDNRMAFRGDALELLAEYLLKSSPNHTKHGISEYTIIPLHEDFGVDATGINIMKNNVVVQCKFRRNPLNLVHYSDLARTFTSGVISYNLDPKAKKNLWLVTTANDANYNAHKILGKRLHVLGRSHLQSQVDGNPMFWSNYLESVKKSLP